MNEARSQAGRKSAELGRATPAGTDDADWSALMARAQDGDGDAYARLLRAVTPYVRSLAARRLSNPAAAEDAVQDTLLTIHAARHTYDPARPFGPWLVAIAKRRVIDRLRQEMRHGARETEFTPAHETFAADDPNLTFESADHRALRTAIQDLPPGQREAVRLLKLEERSLKEAAALSGMSVGALKVAAHRAVRNLRKMFAPQNSEEP